MAMSKKDFIALADALRDHNRVAVNRTEEIDVFSANQLDMLASYCEAQNPQFMRERWLGYIRGENGKNSSAIRTRKVGA